MKSSQFGGASFPAIDLKPSGAVYQDPGTALWDILVTGDVGEVDTVGHDPDTSWRNAGPVTEKDVSEPVDIPYQEPVRSGP